jgi:hypothetical protein
MPVERDFNAGWGDFNAGRYARRGISMPVGGISMPVPPGPFDYAAFGSRLRLVYFVKYAMSR